MRCHANLTPHQKNKKSCFFGRQNSYITKQLQAYYQQCKSLKKEQNEKHSLRCTQLYTLSLANSLVDAPFWQCYNLDFRGRVYPIAPHFSQMLGDPARGYIAFLFR